MAKIQTVEIIGKYPIRRVRERILIDDPKIMIDETGSLSTDTIFFLLCYTKVLEKDVVAVELSLSIFDYKGALSLFCLQVG